MADQVPVADPPVVDPPVKPTLKALIAEHGLQEDLNVMMADNRRTLNKQNTDLVTQLETIKQNANLTIEERDDLQVRITQIEEQYLSKEELAKRESTKQQREFDQNLKAANESSTKWQGMYSDSTIERSIFDAAVETEAIHPSQIVTLLKVDTILVESEGKYSPVVKFNDVDEAGKNVVLELSPIEALKRMKELTSQHGNLFKGVKQGGVGGTGNADGSNSNLPSLEELKEFGTRLKKLDSDFSFVVTGRFKPQSR